MTCCPTCNQPLPKETGLLVDLTSGRVSTGDKSVRLERQQAEILQVLMDKYPRLAAHDHIMDRINGHNSEQSFTEGCLKVQVCRMRKALAELPLKITTVPKGKAFQVVMG